MNKLSSSPLAINKSYEKPELLKSYPDIDYEMIPIKDDNSFLVGQAKPFYIDQLPFVGIGNNLKTVKRFKLSTRYSSEIPNYFLNISQKKEIKCLTGYGKSNFTFILPLEQMSSCKKTKKFTKFSLTNGRKLKTVISFKKLKKRLLKNGFIKITESHLVPLKK